MATLVTLEHPVFGGSFRTTLDAWNEVWAAKGWVLSDGTNQRETYIGNYGPMYYHWEGNAGLAIGYYDGFTWINHTSYLWKPLDLSGGPLARPSDRVFRAAAGNIVEVGLDIALQLDKAATDWMFFNWGTIGADGEVIRMINPNANGPVIYRVDPLAQVGDRSTQSTTKSLIKVQGGLSHKVRADEVVDGVVRLRPFVKTFPATGGDGFDKLLLFGSEAFGYGSSGVWGRGPYSIRPGVCIVFAGQSLQNTPGGTNDWDVTIGRLVVRKLRARGYEVVEHNNALSGTAYDERLAGFDTEMQYVASWYEKFIYVGTGSYSDITEGSETAAQIYAEAGAMATTAKAAGAMAAIQVTHTKSATITGGGGVPETKRQDYNNLLRADASGYFDDVVDPDALSQFDDYDHTTNPNYYLDAIGHYGDQAVDDISDLIVEAILADPATYDMTFQ